MNEAAETLIVLFGTILICTTFMFLTVGIVGIAYMIWKDMKGRFK